MRTNRTKTSRWFAGKSGFLFLLAFAVGITAFTACNKGTAQGAAGDDPWQKADSIMAAIKPPVFPDRDFLLTDYGAQGDGATDCTGAFAAAIRACNEAGGGRVVVPAGKYLTGPIHLKSNVNLYLADSAEVLFSTDPDDYLPVVYTRFEGVEIMNYSPLIYAYEQENIAVTGSGTLNGQADSLHWWPWKRKGSEDAGWQGPAIDSMKALAKNGVPVRERIFGKGSYLRPNFIQPYKCRNVLIENVTIRNSPMWVMNPVLCNNVTIQGVQVISHGPNSDGCDPESSSNVLIADCYFDTGDDCIAIKSGRDHDGRRVNVPSENIIIRDCVMKDGHGGVVIGSEISGSVRNVFAENCRMSSPNLERALRIKSNSYRGGIVENVFLRNIEVGEVSGAAIRINMFYSDERGSHFSTVRNVLVQNMSCEKSEYAVRIEGEPAHPVEHIRIENSRFENVKKANVAEGVEDLSLQNVRVNGEQL
ncbi:polygalacturonase [Anseongella ginsenosidimutans]|uniref:Polygalacturonase n=1 Tax=Anseongella ginsenosidimutans TaxID=496056 RepID=A0A4R3KMC6_9SPHI|nr:glycoside hydrolase family 28 protein [Anseongella ginsenosidimutans]QEC53776.1 glycoside hydrolase family 28 protein [Anseongella ginsenosidimutans]TCS84918.1 polygalacturonase [Anseongella ginsenosidimutans]